MNARDAEMQKLQGYNNQIEVKYAVMYVWQQVQVLTNAQTDQVK
jgi:hypothetical protein